MDGGVGVGPTPLSPRLTQRRLLSATSCYLCPNLALSFSLPGAIRRGRRGAGELGPGRAY